MTIEDLIAFVAIYQQKSISKAAYKLNITQSALSKRIKAIEVELKADLLDTHNKRRLQVTSAGELFYHYALRTTSEFYKFRNELLHQQDIEKNIVKLGTIPILGQYEITSLLANFQKKYTNISLKILEQQGTTLLHLLDTYEIDAAILRDTQTQELNSKDYVRIPLLQDELSVILSVKNKLAQKNTLKISDLASQDIVSLVEGSGVYEPLQKLFASQNLTPTITLQSSHIETLLGTIKSTNSISMLFNQSVKPFMSNDFVTRSLEPKFYSNLELVYRKIDLGNHSSICNLGHFLQQQT